MRNEKKRERERAIELGAREKERERVKESILLCLEEMSHWSDK